MIPVSLPWPNKLLSSNARGITRSAAFAKAEMTKKHRQWAVTALRSACGGKNNATWRLLPFIESGVDIPVRIIFHPPSNRFDRQNMPGLVKAYCDGFADEIGVNDRRFLPEYVYAAPAPPLGRVEVEIGEAE